MRADRRTILTGIGAGSIAAGIGMAWPAPEAAVAGTLAGADIARGHALRDGGFPPPTVTEDTGVVIAGGGIAGLSAGWTLAEAGFADFRLLELEDEAGGNARGGRNAVSAYPLGAHYLPVPNREAKAVRHLLTRLGIVTGEKDGAPVYDPYQLCADSQERLLWQGRYHEGLVPRTGLSEKDAADIARFFAEMRAFSARVGADGRRAFAIPIAYSAREADLMALDAIRFTDWLAMQDYTSPVLHAHLRYACRDDYGCEPRDVSAWAGIHYFASRRGWAADDAGDNELTWPEGNARLARAIAARFADRIAPGRIVHRVTRDGGGVAVDAFDVRRQVTVRTRARAAILAMPRFIASRVAPSLVPADARYGYAPWVVANVTVNRLPEGRGAKLAWDNVSATSASLGYVVATHQSLSTRPAGSVLTWYMPLSDMAPADARRLLLARPLAEWQAIVRDDLLAMNPDLEGAIRRIDVWRWGHAMVRPVPGFIWGRKEAAPAPSLFLAHSDMSGLSIFEEAHYHGTAAAEGAMRHLDHSYETLL